MDSGARGGALGGGGAGGPAGGVHLGRDAARDRLSRQFARGRGGDRRDLGARSAPRRALRPPRALHRGRRRGEGGSGDDLGAARPRDRAVARSEEHTSELQSLMRISYAVFSLNKKITRVTGIYRHESKK